MPVSESEYDPVAASAAISSGDPEWTYSSACETTPSAHAGDHHVTLETPARTRIFPLPMIRRRSPTPSSFVLAAARLRALQLDPWPRGDVKPGSCEEDPQNSQPSPAVRVVTGSGSYALLTLVAHMGAADRAAPALRRLRRGMGVAPRNPESRTSCTSSANRTGSRTSPPTRWDWSAARAHHSTATGPDH
jgi:hypothetical protein